MKKTMSKQHFKFVAKLDWFMYLILELFGCIALGYAAKKTLAYPEGWQEGLFIFLFAVPFMYLMGFGLVKRAFVWSQIIIDDESITQSMFGRDYKIDLSQQWEHQYIALLDGHASLRMPNYQFVEIRQGSRVVRLLPCWLTPEADLDALPISLHNIWQEYGMKA